MMRSRTAVSSLHRAGLHDGLPACQVSWDQAVVLSVARGIEPDPEKALQWFLTQPIAEFGGRTARQLVEDGATAPLLDMLVAVRRGHRGA
jgi:hypothetical protein